MNKYLKTVARIDNELMVAMAIFVIGVGVLFGVVTLLPGSYNLAANTSGSTVTFANPKSANTKISITTGALSKSTPISQYDFGADEVWYDNGYGAANPDTEQPYSSLVNLTKSIGVSIMRYPGGNPSDIFNWEDAIGPQAGRPDTLIDGSSYKATGAVPSTFGPDEFGTLLNETGAAGNITVNFDTGTPTEAADWVCYMTAPVNDKSDPACDKWAAMRAADGHAAPYNIPYWEVGNEPYVGQYWRGGTVISSPNKSCKTGDYACLYIFGGTTRLTNQAVYAIPTQTGANSKVNKYYVPDPPIDPAYAPTLSVGTSHLADGKTVHTTTTWQAVTPQVLAKAPATLRAFSINDTTGEISFGNGTHGAKLPANANLTISYASGPHAGFNTFYQQMKKADPSAHVCESYYTPAGTSLQFLGSKYPYDCYVVHDYAVVGYNNSAYSANQFHDETMLSAQKLNDDTKNVQAQITKYAGKNAKHVQIAMTEYGILNYESPKNADIESASSLFAGQTDYHRSLDLGLYVANMLRNDIESHVSLAEKHYLVGYDFSQAPGLQGSFNSHEFAGNAMIDTVAPTCNATSCSDPEFIAQPSAYVFEEYTKYLYKNLLTSHVSNDPNIGVSSNLAGNQKALSGSYPKLETVATTNGKGGEALLVINDSDSAATTATIQAPSSKFKSVDAWTLGGNYLAFNTPSSPNAISLVSSHSQLYSKKVAVTFPASSVSVLQFSTKAIASTPPAPKPKPTPTPTCKTAPSVPKSLTATGITTTQVTLSWKASTLSSGCKLKSYSVKENGKVIASPTTTKLTVSKLKAATAYTFTVAAITTNGHSSAASTALKVTTKASATTPTPTCKTAPSVPKSLTATSIATTQVTLSWKASTLSSGCKLKSYSVKENGKVVASPTATKLTVSSLKAATVYTFTVAATTTNGYSSAVSTALKVTTKASAPAPTPTPTPKPTGPSVPTGLVKYLDTPNTISFGWQPSTDSSAKIVGYDIYQNSKQIATVSSAITYFLDGPALTPNTSYTFTVAAYTQVGAQKSAQSSPLVVKTLNIGRITSKCQLGDFNNNQYDVVGLEDLSILLSHYGQKASQCDGAIANPGGVVNLTDLSEFEDNYTGGGTSIETGAN